MQEVKEQNKPTIFKLIKVGEEKTLVDEKGVEVGSYEKGIHGIKDFEQAVKFLHWD